MNEELKALQAQENAELAKARLAAQMKLPADYDAAQDDQRSASEVAADLARLRLELTATVDELAQRLDPKNFGSELTVQAKQTATKFSAKAKELGTGVLNGDRDALKKVGLIAAGICALFLLRRFGK